MDLLKDILSSKGPELIAAVLDKSDLGREEAEAFVPEAGKSVAEALARGANDLDLSNLASGANVAALMEKVDIGGLAQRVGLTPDRGSGGLAAMLPLLLRFLGENDQAVQLLSGLGKAGDVLDGLKGLGKKLFG